MPSTVRFTTNAPMSAAELPVRDPLWKSYNCRTVYSGEIPAIRGTPPDAVG